MENIGNRFDSKIRKHFKTFTPIELIQSGYLYKVNSDDTPIENIMSALDDLYKYVSYLKLIIDSGFKIENVKNPATRNAIKEDYNIKNSILLKALMNDATYLTFMRYQIAKREEEKSLKR